MAYHFRNLTLDTQVLFGTPHVASDWDAVLLKLVLATTDASTDQGAQVLQLNLGELVRKGPSALEACALRYKMIETQYKTIRIFEGIATDGIGKVVCGTPAASASTTVQ